MARKSAFFYFVDSVKFHSLSEAARKYGVSNTSILNWCSDGKKGKSNCWREPKNTMAVLTKGNNEQKENQSLNQEPGVYETAEQYLEAVVQGLEFADSARITAARCLLAYQLPKQRVKPETPAPRVLRKKQERKAESDNLLKFKEKADKIRAKYQKEQAK